MKPPTTEFPTEAPDDSTLSPATVKAALSEPAKTGLSRHLNASFLRDDSWETLRLAANRLSSGERVDEARQQVRQALQLLGPIEFYWAFPGKYALRKLEQLFEDEDWHPLARGVNRITRLLASGTYRRRGGAPIEEGGRDEDAELGLPSVTVEPGAEIRPYFEVLLVDALGEDEEGEVRDSLLALRSEDDPFVYDIVIVPSAEDALIAVLFNYNIQSCVVRYSVPFRSQQRLEALQSYLSALGPQAVDEHGEDKSSLMLGKLLREVRPELDLFLVTDTPVEEIAGSGRLPFRRVFYRQEDYGELHSNLLKGVVDRYRTPFFSALKSYSQRPTGVFHAMPLSRGKSIARSHWIQDMARFYGNKIFQAETSATTGGLDSLLQPQGTLREAQDLAARAFRARRTYFVTNGTSTANKIVTHSLLRPGDIALLARDCHKSHHYAMQLAGAQPLYLDPYPLSEFSFYGAVPLRQIKSQLLELRKAGKLERARMVLLTNCTFDGITYDPERVMAECLAIKPDLIFLWDEAWFAFASFHPTLRRRTAMDAARRLRDRLRSQTYRQRYDEWREEWDALPDDDARWLDRPLMPDPSARLRVYATQSTHKTLTSLRQGSMIHVFDQDFERLTAETFTSSYMTFTSTSPNYQILASLDIGRRQVELEGYELVQRSLEMAMVLRRRLESHPLLRKYFHVLRPADVVPESYRPSGLEGYYDRETGWSRMETAWDIDEFALDPTRVTVQIAGVGMDGDTFKKHLMDTYDTQINKTSRNTVLFMVHIGTSRSAVAHLIEVMTRIAESLEEHHEDLNPAERDLYERKVKALTEELPPLPNFSRFHRAFMDSPDSTTREGDLRSATFLAYDGDLCEYLPLDGAVQRELEGGREIVSASFVTPYPPGFPVLVPGQILSPEILRYLEAIDVKEIHGYQPEYGLRVFTERALQDYQAERKTAC